MKPSLPSEILHQIAQIQRMEPGKLCIIGHGPQGPYYNLQCRENGKPLSRYVPKEQLEAVALHTANYQKFQDLVAEYARLIIEQTRAERMSGSKKKTQSRSSCWHRSRKSST